MGTCTGRQGGFTLIEAMVTVAVLAIIAAIAMPRMMAFVNANRLSGAAGEMASALQLARSEASRRNVAVTLCGTTDGTTCASSGSWSRWIITGADNAGGTTDVIRDETVRGPLQVTGPTVGIRFRSSGLVDTQTSLNICIPTSDPAENKRVVTVMVSGMVRTTKANGSGACS